MLRWLGNVRKEGWRNERVGKDAMKERGWREVGGREGRILGHVDEEEKGTAARSDGRSSERGSDC